jgi:hypothetical protein
MEILLFSHNWNNKLGGVYFTTLRLHNPSKYKVGAQFAVKYKKSIMNNPAEVVKVKEMKLDQLNEYICGLDTGYSVEETKKVLQTMYKFANWNTQTLDLVLLKYTNESVLEKAPELFG